MRSGTLRGSCGENCIPNCGRSFAIDAELSEFELTFPDPMHEFNAGDGDRGASKALQSKHRTQTKFDRSMVLLNTPIHVSWSLWIEYRRATGIGVSGARMAGRPKVPVS